MRLGPPAGDVAFLEVAGGSRPAAAPSGRPWPDPPVGRPAWLEYDFARPTEISSAQVYWFDDKRFCRLPASWQIQHRRGNEGVPVAAHDSYDVLEDTFNIVTFDPVVTTAVRLEVEPRTVSYEAGEIGPPAAMFLDEDVEWRELGVIEWRVE